MQNFSDTGRCSPLIPVLFQDKNIIVALKPPGLLSQAGPGEDILTALGQQEHCTLFPVHRLDRGVGGVMVFAKTSAAAGKLSAAIQQGKLEKEYLCVTRGCPAAPSGVYKDLLLHDKSRNKTFVVDRMRGGVKEASLEYRVLREQENLALVHVKLHTGRTHQIRVQFSSRKTPLLGDGKYGGGSGQIALWSYRLSLPHPATGKVMAFTHLPQGDVWDGFDLSSI